MFSDFSIALGKFNAFARKLPYASAIRIISEDSAEPRLVLYILDEAYDSELQRNALNLLLAMWKYTEGDES